MTADKLLLNRAKDLRRRSSDAEQLLWRYLRDRQIEGYKFRRQVVIEPYIADFACLEAKLIIEADGGQHDMQRSDDADRTRRLHAMGYRVLRFWNHEILNETQNVLEQIRRALIEFPHPNPLPEGEGGTCR